MLVDGVSIDDPSQDLAYIGFTGDGLAFLTNQNYQFEVINGQLKNAFILYANTGCSGISRVYAEAGANGAVQPGQLFQSNGTVYYIDASASVAGFAYQSFFDFDAGSCNDSSGNDPGAQFSTNDASVTGYSISDPDNLGTSFQRN